MSALTEDRRSKVPFYTFPGNREQQEEALAANPMLKRFVWSRTALAGDRHRPYYHYVNPEGTLNDPNGLCFWNGLWHLFYQGYPPEDPRQHWGHCVSEDLIHWRDLPYAIYPDPEECCFSGATLVEEDRVIAIYHGTKVGNMVATSSDPLLLNWEKLTGQAVIPMTAPDGGELPYRVFDPCIWRKGDFYYSLSGGTLPHPHQWRAYAGELPAALPRHGDVGVPAPVHRRGHDDQAGRRRGLSLLLAHWAGGRGTAHAALL